MSDAMQKGFVRCMGRPADEEEYESDFKAAMAQLQEEEEARHEFDDKYVCLFLREETAHILCENFVMNLRMFLRSIYTFPKNVLQTEETPESYSVTSCSKHCCAGGSSWPTICK